MVASELGQFLTAVRRRQDPDGFGLADGAHRRVPGLRRAEVAQLAGISTDYYTRLEQGRERTPSRQVVEALGRALMLSIDSREHLYRLAGLMPATSQAATHDRVSPRLLKLINSIPDAATYVTNRMQDILAMNWRGRLTLAPFAPERNTARILFCAPNAKELTVDWERAARSTVGSLRLAAALKPHDPEVRSLIAELGLRSSDFDAMWRENDVGWIRAGYSAFRHPSLGLIEFEYQAFDVREPPGQQLFVCSFDPGSATAEAFERARGRVGAGRSGI